MYSDWFYPICKFYEVIGVDRTLTYLNDRIELNPEDAQAWMLLGNFHDDTVGESDQALRDYSTAIAIDPNYADAYVKRSSTHHDRGEYQQALDDAEEAIRLNPDPSLAYVNRAAALAALGRDAEADLDVARAVERGYDPVGLLGLIDTFRAEREQEVEPPEP